MGLEQIDYAAAREERFRREDLRQSLIVKEKRLAEERKQRRLRALFLEARREERRLKRKWYYEQNREWISERKKEAYRARRLAMDDRRPGTDIDAGCSERTHDQSQVSPSEKA